MCQARTLPDDAYTFYHRSLNAHLPPGDFGKLHATPILVGGLGGGSTILELLARKGFSRFIIADPDHYEPHNIRQIGSLLSTQGRRKSDVMSERLRDIYPHVQVTVIPEGITPENVADLVRRVDYVIDMIDFDALAIKVKLYQAARAQQKTVLTAPSLANGAILFVFPPTGITFETFFDYDDSLPLKETGPRMLRRLFPRYPNATLEAICQAAARGERTFPLDAVGVAQAAVLTVTALENLVLGRVDRVVAAPKGIQMDVSDPENSFLLFDFTEDFGGSQS